MGADAPIEHDLGWPVVSLAEIASKIGSGATPKGGADAYLPSRARFALVRSQNVFDRRFDHDGLVFITDEQADGLRGVVLQPDDILLNITGDGITFGRACMVPKDILPACVNQHVSIIRLDPRRADAGYVLAFLTHPDVKSYIESFNAGGSRRAVTKGHIESFRLPLPPLPEQRAIGHILGTLDDKIELNRRMNQTLEAMARALFQSWFVDFDPVRAKAEGRDPRLPKPLADLFPDSFEDSELGEIPKGWEVDAVESLCESITSGGTPARMNALFWGDGTIPWFKTGELLDGPLIESEEHITEAALAGSSCKLWPAGTILFALYASPTVGRLGVLTRPGTSNQAAAGLIAKPEVGVPFLRRLLLDARVGLQTIAVGAAQQNINQGVLKSHRAVIPNADVAGTYSRLVSSLDEQQVALSKQAHTLAALRDTLLPKLISGELRIRTATWPDTGRGR